MVDLTALYLNSLSLSNDLAFKSMQSSMQASKSNSSDFNSYLSKAGEKSSSSVSNSDTNRNSVNSSSKDKSQASSNKNISQKKSQNSNLKNENKSNVEKTSSSVSEKDVVVADKEINDMIIDKISEKLGVSSEDIKEILEKLNIQAADLNDPNNLLMFMQNLLNAETPADLLLIDGIKEMFAEVKDIVEEAVQFRDILKSNPELMEKFIAGISDKDSKTDNQETDNVLADNTSNLTKTADSEKSLNSSVSNNTNPDTTALQNKKTTEQSVTADTSEKASSFNKAVNASNQDSKQSLRQEAAENITAKPKTENIQVPVETTASNNMQQGTSQQNSQQQTLNSNQTQGIENLVQTTNTAETNIAKAFNNVMQKLNTGKNIDSMEVIKQIVEKFKVSSNEKVSEIKVTLNPEYLGDVTLKVASSQGIVTAQFTAQNDKVKEIIESNFDKLREMLNEQGIEVSQLSVNVGTDESSQGSFGFERGKSSKRINDIISSIDSEETIEEESVNYVDEGQVLETNVNYTA